MSETIEEPATGGEAVQQETPEEAMAQLTERLKASEAVATQERQRREQAEQHARQAGNAVAGAHESSVQSQIAAQEANLANARARMAQGREAGDMNMELDANEAIATSRQALNVLKGEHSRILAQRSAPQPPPQQQQGGDEYSPQARAWIARNPRFTTDPIYKGVAVGAHEQAISSGMLEGSQAYFNHLDATLARTFPAGQQQPARKGPPASSYGTPPGRGNAVTPARGADVSAIAAQLGVTQADIETFAKASGMKLADYCKSQADILDERRRSGGGTADFNQASRSFK